MLKDTLESRNDKVMVPSYVDVNAINSAFITVRPTYNCKTQGTVLQWKQAIVQGAAFSYKKNKVKEHVPELFINPLLHIHANNKASWYFIHNNFI